MPVSLEEKIEILIILGTDQDEEIRRKALQTLQAWNTEELRQVLSSATTSPAILDFAASHLASSREELLEALLENPQLSDEVRDRMLATFASESATSDTSSDSEEEGKDGERETLIQKINRMSAVEKIKMALTGNQETRVILIRDANKVVARAVLQSPKITDSEIESYAAAKNVTEEVLRLIAMNRKFRKSYTVIRALVNNPRAPIDVTLPLLNRLNDRDLKGLTLNKNVPEVLRTMSTKIIKAKEEAQKPKLYKKH